jgi:DNA gyrase/topoisomerase IV subunit A
LLFQLCKLNEATQVNNASTGYFSFSDFDESLEGLSAKDLMKTMRSFLSKGVAACQRGFKKAVEEAKASLEERKLLEDENRRLREENEKLKQQSRHLADQSSKQRDAMDALKKELESCLKCYEECRTELKDMVTQYDAQQVLLKANANLIAELKRVKGELEDTLEKNEAYCHQWGAYLATAYRRALESFGAEAQDFKITDNISSFVEWLHSELKLLPDTMSKIGDYGVTTCSEMLLHLLEQQGCDHFKAFGNQSFELPTPEDVPAPSKTIDLINKIILHNF